jgi:signal transduction histidine kinase
MLDPQDSSAATKILIVDDDSGGLYAKRVALEHAGFSVFEASTGAQALEIVSEQNPHLVVLDVKLPDLDGFEVCRDIKRNAKTAATMVLQVSAYYTSATHQVQGLEHGADAYLPGDIPAPLLLAAVRALLRTQRAERRLRDLQEREQRRLAAEAEATAKALDSTQEELRALAASLLTAQEDEARRIARDLHDDLAQELAALEIRLTHLRQHDGIAPEELDPAIEQVVALSDRLRKISHGLHPTLIENLGLDATLRNLCDEWDERQEMPIRYVGDSATAGVARDVATVVYRIAQEALRNIQKHAGDARTVVTLSREGDALVVCIEDDGNGFDVAERRRNSGGLGLLSMEERARLIGARVLIRSSPGQGTRVEVRAPLGGKEVRAS